jgi:hypothetical protein
MEIKDFWIFSLKKRKDAAAQIAPMLPKIENRIIQPRIINHQ